MRPIKDQEADLMLADYHSFLMLFDSALRYWFLRIVGDLADEETKEMLQKDVDFMANREWTFWNIYEKPSPRIKELLDSNTYVKNAIDEYAHYIPEKQLS
jgi:hypothetical protein